MLAANLQSASMSQALEQTFDGKHPCPLCKAVSAGKAAEQKFDFTLELKKLEYPPAPQRFALIAPTTFELLSPANFFAETLPQQPPTPPPRNLFA